MVEITVSLNVHFGGEGVIIYDDRKRAWIYLKPWAAVSRVVEMTDVDSPDGDAHQGNDLRINSFMA